MTFSEINEQIAACVDDDTGEVDVEKLNELIQERDEKIESLARYSLVLKNDAALIDAEIDRLEKRKNAIKNKDKRLREFLMANLNGEKFKTALVSVSKPRTNERLIVDDIEKLPSEYITVTETRKPNTDLIKQAIRDGWNTDAAHIEITQSITIR